MSACYGFMAAKERRTTHSKPPIPLFAAPLHTHTAERKEKDIFLIGTASGRQIPGRGHPRHRKDMLFFQMPEMCGI